MQIDVEAERSGAIGRVVSWRMIRLALLAGTGCYWIGIFILTHLPPSNLPATGVNDKLAHFLAYAVLGTLLYAALWAWRPRQRFAGLIVIGIGLIYGAVDELLQIPVGRQCDLGDWLADGAGVITAVAAMTLVRHIHHRRRSWTSDVTRIR